MQSTHISYNEIKEKIDEAVDYEDEHSFANTADYIPLPVGRQPVSSPDWWSRADEEPSTSYLQNPLALIISIVAMMAWQFHGPIVRWYQNRIQWMFNEARTTGHNTGVLQLMLDATLSVVVAAFDYIRATYQMALEILRRILQWIWCGCELGTRAGRNRDGGIEPNGTGGGVRYQGSSTTTNDRRLSAHQRLRCNSLPELEECMGDPSLSSDHIADAILEHEPTANTTATATAATIATDSDTGQHDSNSDVSVHGRRCCTWVSTPGVELEPAFLNETDYPPDWMVYHPILRVVSKTRADRYDQQQCVNLSITSLSLNNAAPKIPPVMLDEIEVVPYDSECQNEEEKKDDIIGHVGCNLNGWADRDGDCNAETLAHFETFNPTQSSPNSSTAFRSELVT